MIPETPKRVKDSPKLFYFPTGIEHFHWEKQGKERVLIVIVMAQSHPHTQGGKQIQGRSDNFKEQSVQETYSLNNSQSAHV